LPIKSVQLAGNLSKGLKEVSRRAQRHNYL